MACLKMASIVTLITMSFLVIHVQGQESTKLTVNVSFSLHHRKEQVYGKTTDLMNDNSFSCRISLQLFIVSHSGQQDSCREKIRSLNTQQQKNLGLQSFRSECGSHRCLCSKGVHSSSLQFFLLEIVLGIFIISFIVISVSC